MKGARGLKIFGLVIAGLAMACLMGLVLGFVVMWLWNALMPGIFGLPEIGYWQAVGLFILAHLLFKSSGHHDHAHDHFAHRSHPRDSVRAKVKAWLNNGDKNSHDQAEPNIEAG